MKKKKILCFGDSITEGYMVSDENSWPYLLEELSEGRVETINQGVSGDTTLDGLHRLGHALDTAPDIAIVEFGINDLFSMVPVEQAELNLSIITEKFKETGTEVILAGFSLHGSNRWDEMYARVSERHSAILYPDIFNGLKYTDGGFNKKFFLPDGVHPNEHGYAIIAANMFRIIS
jgi:acyl-CoA thioesterase-1